ncbi:MAG: LPS assembly lipoprotein LptE [Aeromonas sp.]
MGTLFTRLMAMMLAALLLQGCGFHMRSHGIPKELMTMKVVGDNKSDFYRMVTTRLKASGVTLADKDGIAVMTLGSIGSTSEVASVNSLGADTEYVLGFSTQFTIAVPGKPIQVFPINFNRSFLNKTDAALASSREQEQLGKEMQEQAANQVIRQLSQVSF